MKRVGKKKLVTLIIFLSILLVQTIANAGFIWTGDGH